jgi:hypothetical protein
MALEGAAAPHRATEPSGWGVPARGCPSGEAVRGVRSRGLDAAEEFVDARWRARATDGAEVRPLGGAAGGGRGASSPRRMTGSSTSRTQRS